jgi:hypothetical protein
MMLKTHFDSVEKELLVTAQRPASSGHNLHKGTPREAFIKEFLMGHLSEKVAIGTGEIIDASSQPGDRRNQNDIVLYRRDYPKIDFGGGISGFLVESAVATIEVKSVLTKEELKKAFISASNTKSLNQNEHNAFRVGYSPPSVMSYLIAYAGPASLNTVFEWKNEILQETGLVYPEMDPSVNQRVQIASPALDGIFILGKGFMYFDNTPLGLLPDQARQDNPRIKWVFCNSEEGNLLLFFMILSQIVSGTSATVLDPVPYLSGASYQNVAWGT